MTAKRNFRRLFRLENDRDDVARAVDDELQFHFDSAVRDLVARGMTEADARREAERRFGDVEGTRRGLTTLDHARVREARRTEWLQSVWQDVQYAARGLRRSPGFALAVTLILALGIGANATMFGIVDRLMFRAPAYLSRSGDVERAYFTSTVNGATFHGAVTSYPRFRDLTDSASFLDAAVAFANPSIAVGTTDVREEHVTFASAGYWKFFDMRPALGRFFTAAEDSVGRGENVAVLSYAYWQSAYGGRSDVLNAHLQLGRFTYTIVGVAPEGFVGFVAQPPIAIVPLASGGDNTLPGNATMHWYAQYGMNWLRVMVRRAPATSQAAMTAALTQRLTQSYRSARAQNAGAPTLESAKPRVTLAPPLEGRGPNQGLEVKVALWLVGVAFIVLVIACANTANLFLARALKRRREIAVRLALGISRRRLLAQFLVESMLLAVCATVAALAVTAWGGTVLRATLLPDLVDDRAATDGRTLLFTGIVALVTGVALGLIPALRSGHASLTSALRSGSRDGTYQHSRLRATLLVLQGALSVVLLVGAGLFVRSLDEVQATPLGFDAHRVAWVSLHTRGVRLDAARERALYDELTRVAESAPGVERASYGLSVPFVSEWEEPLFVQGIDSVNNLGAFQLQVVSPTYFATMGTRLVRGRAIDEHDRAGAPNVVVVSQSMGARLWPGNNALGQCLRIGADTMPCSTVVGIAEDIKSTKLIDDAPWQYYVPHAQAKDGQGGVLFVRYRAGAVADGRSVPVESLRATLQRAMPGAAYVTVEPLESVLDDARRSFALGATMFTLFGVLALLVASVGLYSVIAYAVAQRTQELGVRVALGAQRGDVLRLVMSDAFRSVTLAVLLGLGSALIASRWVEPLLFKTSARDPLVYAGVAIILLLVALIAGIVPALRAARVSPSIALRAD